MSTQKSASQAMQSYLLSVNAAVNQIIDPSTKQPVQIPDFDTLYQAAGNLDTAQYATDMAFVITNLLKRAANYDCDFPAADYPLSFPNDHHMHATMGPEWYWVGCHLNVTDQNGNQGRLGILLSMQKNRCVGVTEQAAAGWTDLQASLCDNIVTITIDMGADQRIIRRNQNSQWPLLGGEASYSVAGDESFWFTCGADTLSGGLDIMPLNVLVNDGDNMFIDINLAPKTEVTGIPFFLQGIPNLDGNGGTGLTPIPRPGIYYSWPQLDVTGTVTAQGNTYTINSGVGWVDHQLLMGSLSNADGAASPVPFIDDPKPFNGWTWQYYNLNNGDAFTCISFITGDMVDEAKIGYGYYLRLINGSWLASYTIGDNQYSNFTLFPAPVCESGSSITEVSIPTDRNYSTLWYPGIPQALSGAATPWITDGTFNNPNWSIGAENPADYKDTSGHGSDGVGFLEAISFESVDSFRARSLEFLATGNYPCQ